MNDEELIGIEEANQVNRDRMTLVKQLMDKNHELEELVEQQKEQIRDLKRLACWNEFVHMVKSGEYQPVKYVPKLIPCKREQDNLFIRCYGTCIRRLNYLPCKEWFLENNLEDELKGIGKHMDMFIKTHIDMFYDALVRTWDEQKKYYNIKHTIRYDLW